MSFSILSHKQKIFFNVKGTAFGSFLESKHFQPLLVVIGIVKIWLVSKMRVLHIEQGFVLTKWLEHNLSFVQKRF